MKALSIRQPWAWLIVNGHKDIENRTWSTNYRGHVLIHASKGMTRAEYEDVEDFLHFTPKLSHIRLPAFEDLQRGGIVGVAVVLDCVPDFRRSSPWHMPDQFGFAMSHACPLPFTPLKGALGFFESGLDVATIERGAQ